MKLTRAICIALCVACLAQTIGEASADRHYYRRPYYRRPYYYYHPSVAPCHTQTPGRRFY